MIQTNNITGRERKYKNIYTKQKEREREREGEGKGREGERETEDFFLVEFEHLTERALLKQPQRPRQ